MYFNERWNRIHTYRLKIKHANRVSCNEIVCLITTKNYIPVTKMYSENEDNYIAITMGLWTRYRLYPGIRHVFYMLASVLELISGIFLLKSAELKELKVEREKQTPDFIFYFFFLEEAMQDKNVLFRTISILVKFNLLKTYFAGISTVTWVPVFLASM